MYSTSILVFCTVVLNSGRPLLYDSRVAPELGSDDSEAAGRGGRRGHAGGDIWIKFEKIDFRTKNLDFSCQVFRHDASLTQATLEPS